MVVVVVGLESWGWRGVGGRGWGCVNNANATSLIIDCVFFSPPLQPLHPNPDHGHHPPPPPTPHSSPHIYFPLFICIALFPSSLLPRSGRLPSPCGFKTQSPHSAVIVIIIIIGSFSRQRWYPRQPGEVAPVPW